ncbi:YbfB/YjiJ family MFS transporter [Acinetobacter rudis]|uniref:YbfB/YjiJ family MFS transporter n=1 Tax=Acinetobacter rudis TaxID=632955 RepID=A0AAW8J8H7_9GAMM|nr:YbfB/YjiJ family MFS transporter [Acinetobacter rudis]MDQ8936357.1 YbfB/YjiJ family MFS transporter [Acinetobacter rudis]MDQ9018618.1 YbfB/YjiJ family MFS transporter [Acinetobacter rudis]
MNANAMTNFQRLSIIALCTTSLGIGILRFAYTALMPMTIDQHWWNTAFANDLANANLVGYFIGAILSIKFISETWVSRSLALAAIFGCLSLLSCGISTLPDLWYLFWRLVSGVSGGLLMVLGPSYSLKRVSVERKYQLSLIAFSGIGLGVLLTTTLLPQLGEYGVAVAWYALAAIGLVLTIILITLLKPLRQTNIPNSTHTITDAALTPKQYYIVILVILTYFMSAIGYIPHSIYWVDFVVHHLNHSQNFANMLWMVYGLGSVFGAITTYLCLKRWTSYSTLWRLYFVYAAVVALPAFWTQTPILIVSSFFGGLLNPATVSLTATLLSELVPTSLQRQIWGIAVVVFAIAQFSAGFIFTYLLQHALPYPQIYLIAAVILAVAVILGLLLVQKLAQPHHHSGG